MKAQRRPDLDLHASPGDDPFPSAPTGQSHSAAQPGRERQRTSRNRTTSVFPPEPTKFGRAIILPRFACTAPRKAATTRVSFGGPSPRQRYRGATMYRSPGSRRSCPRAETRPACSSRSFRTPHESIQPCSMWPSAIRATAPPSAKSPARQSCCRPRADRILYQSASLNDSSSLV